MSLSAQLSAVVDHVNKNAPEKVRDLINKTRFDASENFDASKAVKEGDDLPPFKLPNALGKETSSDELLSKGPILITFYRGEWCPYCSLVLRALQQHLEDFQKKGVALVAVSPELPDISTSTAKKLDLKFEVLSDIGNKYAKQLGIVFQEPRDFAEIHKSFGTDMKDRNGDDSLQLPYPSTFLVDKHGKVKNAHIEADWAKRLDIETALGWVDKL